jgi:hypothetical protein
MARPLRSERPGAWYHVTARGTERRVIYCDAPDRRRWLELLAEAVARFDLTMHGYAPIAGVRIEPGRVSRRLRNG